MLDVAGVTGEEDVVVTLARPDHLEGEGRDIREIEGARRPAAFRSAGGGAAWRVWPKWTVTSPGAVVESDDGEPVRPGRGPGRREVPR